MADKGLANAEAGVDFDAGDRVAEPVKPLLRTAARPGPDP
jgi:hypothetical protein